MHGKLTLHPDIGTGGNGKDQQEADEKECLESIGGHSLGREDHGSDKLTLSRTETSPEYHGETSAVRRWITVSLQSGLCRSGRTRHATLASPFHLQGFRAREDDTISVCAVHVQSI